MQQVDQTIGPLTASKIIVDESGIGSAFDHQALGLGRGRARSSHVRSQSPQLVLQSYAEVP
jgi:hypothetical protein